MASIIKVDTIQDQDGNNIINESANTITIGASGDTITIPSGATLANSGIVTGFQSTGIDDNATSTAITINSSQNVGIGTSNPGTALEVNGVGFINATGSTLGRLIIRNSVTSGVAGGLDIDINSTDANIFNDTNGHLKFGTNGTERMRITNTGNVGIGTTTPATSLEVEGTTRSNNFFADGTGYGIKFNLDGTATLNTTAEPVIFSGQGFSGDYLAGSLNLQSRASTVARDISFITGAPGVKRMTISGTGDVGIGTSSPTQPLTIYKSGSNANLLIQSHNSTPGSYNQTSLNFALSSSASATLNWDINAEQTGLTFDYEGSEKMRIDSSGKVGIGETSMDALLVIKGDSDENTTPSIRLKDGSDTREAWITNNSGDLILTTGGDDNVPHTQLRMLNGNLMTFKTNNTERMRIDSSGYLYLNTTTRRNNGIQSIDYDGNSAGGMGINDTASANASPFIGFLSGGTFRGSITNNNNTAVAYNTTSDYRLKENVNYDFNATTRLKQLKPARFNFIADANRTVDGFLAHEVSSVVPEAITGEKDAVDEKGNPVYQGIDQSKLVPLLVKTIQELEARITALENNQP